MTRKHNHPGQCFPGSRDCELEDTSAAHREHWAAAAAGKHLSDANGIAIALPCVFRGPQIPRQEAPDSVRDWYECQNGYGIVCPCVRCNSACGGFAIANVFRSFDAKNLFPAVPGVRFNASIVRWKDKNFIAFRNRSYASQIWIGRMCDDWKPLGEPWCIEVTHTRSRDGQDDPRFFAFAGRLHLSFTGVERTATRTRTNVLYCQLDDDGHFDQQWFCDYDGRNDNEKNWGFFQYKGQLLASYSLAPHRVLSVDGHCCRMQYVTATHANWSGGEMRGGASPVLVNGTWYSFFHSSQLAGGAVEYWTGLATFDDCPPFQIKKVSSQPILRPDRRGSSTSGKHVVYTCGAHHVGGINSTWLLSSGVDDRFCDLRKVDLVDVDQLLQQTAHPPLPDPERDVDFIRRSRALECMRLEGWCSAEKASWLCSAVLQGRTILSVELGVFRGRSLAAVALALKQLYAEGGKHGAILGIDAYSYLDQVDGIDDSTHREWAAKIDWEAQYHAAAETIHSLHPFATLIRTTSTAASRWVRPEIDLLHIDAGHGEASSRRDVREWLPLVRRGGIIVLDDTDWPTVQAALQDLRSTCEPIFDGRTWQAFRKI